MIILKDPIIQNSSKSLGSDPVCNLIGYEWQSQSGISEHANDGLKH
jgi:hypothetical protein